MMRKGHAPLPADETLQKFTSLHTTVHKPFNQDRQLNTRQNDKDLRSAALAEWKPLMARGQKRPALAPPSGDILALG